MILHIFTEAKFPPASSDSLHLQLAWAPRYPDLVIFVSTAMTITTTTDCFTPCTCAWGNYYKKIRALRAHTPCEPCICTDYRATWTYYAVDDLYLHVRGQLYARMSICIMHSEHGRWAMLRWLIKIYYL